jgi:ribosomal protein S18 acetylase RimI-like enzyme
VQFIHVESGPEIDEVRALFREYARSLNFSLCFQSFEEELRDLPGEYGLPHGRLLLSRFEGKPAGCIAMKRLEPRICEMKRLYVRPEFRGRQLGRELTAHLIEEASRMGYAVMRLDTIPGAMEHAITLYRSLGFKETPPYYSNPIPGAIYMELDLTGG